MRCLLVFSTISSLTIYQEISFFFIFINWALFIIMGTRRETSSLRVAKRSFKVSSESMAKRVSGDYFFWESISFGTMFLFSSDSLKYLRTNNISRKGFICKWNFLSTGVFPSSALISYVTAAASQLSTNFENWVLKLFPRLGNYNFKILFIHRLVFCGRKLVFRLKREFLINIESTKNTN